MIISAKIEDKVFGDKRLFTNAKIFVDSGEKVGLIGRNGEGKTTLFRMLTGSDTDYQGEVVLGRGVTMMATEQEHYLAGSQTVMDYIMQSLPEYNQLKQIIDTYPETMGDDMAKIEAYSEALERFDSHGYYTVESVIERALSAFQLEHKLLTSMAQLSGGQKRLVEVAKVMAAKPELCLIDEPTNHMDFYAKNHFIQWLSETKSSALVITHDRDVLSSVDRILEVKDKQIISYRGNYQAYLKQNMVSTSNQMNAYETVQRRIDNLKVKVVEFQRMKERARDPGTIQRFKRLERQSRDELHMLQEHDKPTFWVDKGSAQDMKLASSQQYDRHKAKNIQLSGIDSEEGHERLLVDVRGLSLGYDDVLFSDLSFQVREGELVELRGRNGAGKSTLIKTMLATAGHQPPEAKIISGTIEFATKLRIGIYEQEMPTGMMDKTLYQAIEHIYMSRDLSIGDTKIRQLMSDYLFNQGDGGTLVARLSGGQKARLQLITMLAADPSLLVLDEPTNHLDLPSIEELELALQRFKGAILYVSHDTYFRQGIGGNVVEL